MPAHINRNVIRQMARDLKWPPLFAYDGKKSMYVALPGGKPFLEQSQREWDVKAKDEEDGRENDYKVGGCKGAGGPAAWCALCSNNNQATFSARNCIVGVSCLLMSSELVVRPDASHCFTMKQFNVCAVRMQRARIAAFAC